MFFGWVSLSASKLCQKWLIWQFCLLFYPATGLGREELERMTTFGLRLLIVVVKRSPVQLFSIPIKKKHVRDRYWFLKKYRLLLLAWQNVGKLRVVVSYVSSSLHVFSDIPKCNLSQLHHGTLPHCKILWTCSPHLPEAHSGYSSSWNR